MAYTSFHICSTTKSPFTVSFLICTDINIWDVGTEGLNAMQTLATIRIDTIYFNHAPTSANWETSWVKSITVRWSKEMEYYTLWIVCGLLWFYCESAIFWYACTTFLQNFSINMHYWLKKKGSIDIWTIPGGRTFGVNPFHTQKFLWMSEHIAVSVYKFLFLL